MKNSKSYQIFIVPCRDLKEETYLWKERGTQKLGYGHPVSEGAELKVRYYHMFLCSETLPKEGDWYYDFMYKTVHQCNDVLAANIASGMIGIYSVVKVEYATDPKCGVLPIPNHFIALYASRGGDIETWRVGVSDEGTLQIDEPPIIGEKPLSVEAWMEANRDIHRKHTQNMLIADYAVYYASFKPTYTAADMMTAYRQGKVNAADRQDAFTFEGGQDAFDKANIPATEWIKTYKPINSIIE